MNHELVNPEPVFLQTTVDRTTSLEAYKFFLKNFLGQKVDVTRYHIGSEILNLLKLRGITAYSEDRARWLRLCSKNETDPTKRKHLGLLADQWEKVPEIILENS